MTQIPPYCGQDRECATGSAQPLFPLNHSFQTLQPEQTHYTALTMAPNKYAVGQDERTFLMIKPDGVQRGLVGEIIKRFEAKGWKLVGLKQMMVPRDLAEKHYGDLREKYFFEGLVQFITSGPVVAMVWQGHGIVKGARTLLGETNPVNSAPGTIRGDLSCDIGRNIVHGSDSTETAQDEISTWFPEGTITWRQADINWVYENELDLADYKQ